MCLVCMEGILERVEYAELTLFAGLVFSFAKMFLDSVLLARAAMAKVV